MVLIFNIAYINLNIYLTTRPNVSGLGSCISKIDERSTIYNIQIFKVATNAVIALKQSCCYQCFRCCLSSLNYYFDRLVDGIKCLACIYFYFLNQFYNSQFNININFRMLVQVI